MARSNVEREIKLEAGVGFSLPPLDDVAPGAQVVAKPELAMQTVYFDTPDLRLMRSGVTLRHRQERQLGPGGEPGPPVNEWTLKLPDDSASPAGTGVLLVRRELTWTAPRSSLPHEADSMVRALRRTVPLGPVARMSTHRRRHRLVDADGQALAEIDDDVVSVMDGRRLAARFREIEVEVADAAPEEIGGALAEVLVSAGARRSDGRPKVVRARGSRATEAPDVCRVRPGRDATLAEVVAGAIADGFLRLLANDPGVRLDEDPENVHRARVATRRLRSDLRTFRDLVDPAWLRATRGELGWVASALGEVRDADVLTEGLRHQIASLSEADAGAAAWLITSVIKQRERARAALLQVLDSDRYLQLLDRLADAAVALPPPPQAEAPGAADEGAQPGQPAPPATAPAMVLDAPAHKVAGAIVVKPWRHLERAVSELGDEPDDEDLHEVRIRAKRLRYACEALAGTAGEPAAAMAVAAARLQTVLGDFHDAVVAEAWLRGVGAEASPLDAMVAGQLITLERQSAAAGRKEWRGAWKELDRKRLRSWLARAR
ncbi:MAG: CHAD domain-containing protein [Acidimicrobiales bacterium]